MENGKWEMENGNKQKQEGKMEDDQKQVHVQDHKNNSGLTKPPALPSDF